MWVSAGMCGTQAVAKKASAVGWGTQDGDPRETH